jgi:hypothetical protein
MARMAAQDDGCPRPRIQSNRSAGVYTSPALIVFLLSPARVLGVLSFWGINARPEQPAALHLGAALISVSSRSLRPKSSHRPHRVQSQKSCSSTSRMKYLIRDGLHQRPICDPSTF